jgi:hypothetical protein
MKSKCTMSSTPSFLREITWSPTSCHDTALLEGSDVLSCVQISLYKSSEISL